MARGRTASWLLGLVLAVCWSSAAGLQVAPGPSGIRHGAASSTREAQLPQTYALVRELPRILASETNREKPNRGHDRKRFGFVSEAAPQPPGARPEAAPILSSDVLWSASFPAFEPRGPPSLIV